MWKMTNDERCFCYYYWFAKDRRFAIEFRKAPVSNCELFATSRCSCGEHARRTGHQAFMEHVHIWQRTYWLIPCNFPQIHCEMFGSSGSLTFPMAYNFDHEGPPGTRSTTQKGRCWSGYSQGEKCLCLILAVVIALLIGLAIATTIIGVQFGKHLALGRSDPDSSHLSPFCIFHFAYVEQLNWSIEPLSWEIPHTRILVGINASIRSVFVLPPEFRMQWTSRLIHARIFISLHAAVGSRTTRFLFQLAVGDNLIFCEARCSTKLNVRSSGHHSFYHWKILRHFTLRTSIFAAILEEDSYEFNEAANDSISSFPEPLLSAQQFYEVCISQGKPKLKTAKHKSQDHVIFNWNLEVIMNDSFAFELMNHVVNECVSLILKFSLVFDLQIEPIRWHSQNSSHTQTKC